MSKTILIVGGGILQCYAIQEAKRRGYHVVVTDADPQCPGAKMAAVFYEVSINDIEGHRAIAGIIQRNFGRLDGVMTCGADCAPTVAAVADAAGIPGIPHQVACNTHDKLIVRGLLNATLSGREGTKWEVTTLPMLKMTLNRQFSKDNRTPIPVVIKPRNERASRGVTIIHDPEDLYCAINRLETYGNPGDVFLVEEYHQGTEHSAEIIFNQDGKPCYFNLCDRWFSYDHGIPIELGHGNPSVLPPRFWYTAFELLKQCAQALRITWGPLKADLILTPNIHEPGDIADWKVLEVTARLSGGFDSQLTAPLSTGKNPIGLVMDLAVGQPVTALPHDWTIPGRESFAACWAVELPPGRIRALPTRENLCAVEEALPGVQYTIITVRVGEVIHAQLDHCAQRPGFVIADGSSMEKTLARAQQGAKAMAECYAIEPIP